jgi:hypothetical protein
MNPNDYTEAEIARSQRLLEQLFGFSEADTRLEDDEELAAILGVDVDEYLEGKSHNRHYQRWVKGPHNVDETDELAF